jgi:hypothetical protein
VDARNPHKLIELRDRTRFRNGTIWALPLDWGGVLVPLQGEAEILASLGRPQVESYMAITDELFAIKEYQRNKETEISDKQIAQGYLIADEKAATERQKLAIKMAAETYLQSARLYDAMVRTYIMAAKEYAAQVEQEQVELERRQAELAVAKEEARLKEINAEIYYEYVKRMEVEVDIARAQVDVAKANTRAIMADLDAQEAELQIIEAQLKAAMMVAEKATLQADIAMTYAEIITKGLAAIKLDVERTEIEKGFEYIQSKLTDLLKIWDTRIDIEDYRTQSEQEILNETLLLLDGEKAAEDLRTKEMTYNEGVQEYEETETLGELEEERSLRAQWVAAREALLKAKSDAEITINDLNTWAKLIANKAQRWVHKHHSTTSTQGQDMKLYVDKG